MNRIKELRESRNMTQVRLSIELEVSQETISAYEKGKYYPSFQSLLKLSKIFNASIDYIMGVSDNINTENNLSPKEMRLIALFKNLNATNKEKALAYLQGLSEK